MRDIIRVPRAGEVIDLAGESFRFSELSRSRDAVEMLECSSITAMEEFVAARDSLPTRLHGFVKAYTVEHYLTKRARLFLTSDAQGGFAIIGEELASLFSLPGAHYGDKLVAGAIERGVSKLSCFDSRGKLLALYGRHGFYETFRASFNDSLAPKDWDYAAWGRPDYVEMSR